jgi:RNA polymerase sigma-70 factor (ECF subfamily)
VRELVASGDFRAAAGVAIRGLGQEVLRYLWSTLRDEADVCDAHSHWAEGLWRGLHSFRFQCSLRTWALRLATNTAINVRNAAWRRRVRRFRTGEASDIAAETRASSLARVEREARGLEALRDALSLWEQALLALRIDQRLSWEAIAEVLSREGRSVSAGTVRKRFERIKDRLRLKARQQGLVE